MIPEFSSSSSRPRAPAPQKSGNPLDGEVIPPTIRVINPEREASAAPEPRRAPFQLHLGTALLAGALVATLSGAGALEAYRWHLHVAHVEASVPSPTAVALARLGKDVGDLKTSVASVHQDDTVKALKKSVDQLKAELDGVRSTNAASVAQL